MGLVKIIVYTIIILIAIHYFFPEKFDQGRDYLVDIMKSKAKGYVSEKFNYTVTGYGKDYGLILGTLKCQSNEDCQNFFQIDEIVCESGGNCIVVVQND